MATLKEVNQMSDAEFIKKVLSAEKTEEKSFNSDISFDEQLKHFKRFTPSKKDFDAVIRDAKKFR